MRKLPFLLLLSLLVIGAALVTVADRVDMNPLPGHFPTKARFAHENIGAAGSGSNLIYHTGGQVLVSANVIPIFWGPSWNTSGNPDFAIANSLSAYISNGAGGFGQTGEYNVITQYYQTIGGTTTHISKSNLGSAGGALYDTSTPPQNVTDGDVQAEVLKMTNNNPRTDTVYEVFLPSSSYSSDGTSTSCGGPNLQYCAYHGHFSSGNLDVKYASMPYPSCGGCQSAAFNTTQNFEHFISHETREAVTDEDLSTWYDRRGNEADDKCAWSPTPFTDSSTGTNTDGSAYAYQYEWSNANGGCVKTR